MKALVLAAGYATRMYPLTKDKAKPLLLMRGQTMLDHCVQKLEAAGGVDGIFVVTNAFFADDFAEWIAGVDYSTPIHLLNDGTSTNDTRLGAVGDIDFSIKNGPIDDELLVMGGDNLFDFDLSDLTAYYRSKGQSCVVLHDVGDLELVKAYSVVEVGSDDRVVGFEEKPADPQSTLAAICIYMLSRESVGLVARYLAEGGRPDQPGYFIQWLYRQVPVYGYKAAGTWYDIGSLRTYEDAQEHFGG